MGQSKKNAKNYYIFQFLTGLNESIKYIINYSLRNFN